MSRIQTTRNTLLNTHQNNLALDWNTAIPEFSEDTHGINKLYAIREDWLSKLKLLRSRSYIKNPPTENQVKTFAGCLINKQHIDHKIPRESGSWKLVGFYNESDVRVNLIYFPSYIAVSYLTLIKLDYPMIADTIDGFDTSLRRGLRFITRRDFSGHGYNSIIEMVQTIRYLSFGKVFTLTKNSEFSSLPFHNAVLSATQQIIDNVESSPTYGVVDKVDADIALKLLEGADSYDHYILDNLYRDWALRHKAPFCIRLTEEISALLTERIRSDIKEEIKSLIGRVCDELELLKPKYTVFEKHRRIIETSPIILKTSINCKDIRDDLKSYADYIPKDYFNENFCEIISVMKRDIACALEKQLNIEIVDIDREILVKISGVEIDVNSDIRLEIVGISAN